MVATDERSHHNDTKPRSCDRRGGTAVARRTADILSARRRRDTSISSVTTRVKFNNQISVSNIMAPSCRRGDKRFLFIDPRSLIIRSRNHPTYAIDPTGLYEGGNNNLSGLPTATADGSGTLNALAGGGSYGGGSLGSSQQTVLTGTGLSGAITGPTAGPISPGLYAGYAGLAGSDGSYGGGSGSAAAANSFGQMNAGNNTLSFVEPSGGYGNMAAIANSLGNMPLPSSLTSGGNSLAFANPFVASMGSYIAGDGLGTPFYGSDPIANYQPPSAAAIDAQIQNNITASDTAYNATWVGFLTNTLSSIPQSWNKFNAHTPAGWLGSLLGSAGNSLNNWGSAEASNGPWGLGGMAIFVGGVSDTMAGMTNPVGGLLSLGGASVSVGERDGVVAGIAYGTGSLVGATQLTESYAGKNFLTGQYLDGADRWSMAFQGLSAASGAAAGVGALAEGMAAKTTTNAVGAMEDWSNVDYAARYAARDNAWETDNAINIHGNSINSPRTAYLYGLYDKATNQLIKWGISQNPATRYSRAFMEDKYLDVANSGPRGDMLQLERNLVETNPGPLNFEPWAGSQTGGQP